jgi:hypothetical protein
VVDSPAVRTGRDRGTPAPSLRLGRPTLKLLRYLLAAAGLTLAIPAIAHAIPAGFAFLEIPAGARAAGMGGAMTALGSGVEAVFWNPAGLDDTRSLEIEAGHAELVEGLRHETFAVAGPAFGGGLAASVRALYTEAIDERDELGNLIGTFGSHDLEFALAYGTELPGHIEAGASAQIVRERIANASTTTYAFGLGGRWTPPALGGLSAAASLQNWGADGQYTIDGVPGRSIPLPTAFQGGIGYAHPFGYGLALRGALEGRFTRGRAGQALIGAEIAQPAGAAVRAGLRVNDTATGFSMGVGYAFTALRLDYAWVPWKLDLGDTHRFSLGARF